MELSAATLELLQHEAYAFLCRQAVLEKLASLEREKEAIASTRPPFGLLARKETREAFTRSMRTAVDNEAALRDRLAQIIAIEKRLQPRLRKDIAAYLADVSPDYVRFAQIRARLVDWERAFLALPELLIAFARDLRGARSAMAAGGANARTLSRHDLVVLYEIAVKVERQGDELRIIAGAINELTPPVQGGEIRLPVLPDLRRLAWVNRLAALPPDEAVPELIRAESEIRAFVNGGQETVIARLEASRDICTQLEANALDLYWNQLRAHARAHYVEDRDIDEVLEMLSQRYANTDILSQLDVLTSDPFFTER